LPDLTSQMRKIKPLKKLRCKPQGSEVFRCGSMGIYAERVNPQEANPRLLTDDYRVPPVFEEVCPKEFLVSTQESDLELI
jgi:hypothetical protein